MTQVEEAQAGTPSDPRRLAEFVGELEKLLLEALRRPELLEPYAAEFQKSWPPNRARLASVRELMLSEPIADLEGHGLTGPELTLKLKLFYDARDQVDDALARIARHPLTRLFGHPLPEECDVDEEGVFAPVRPPRGRGNPVSRAVRNVRGKSVRKLLPEALSIGDTILESVGAAVPGAAVHAAGAGEFKQLVEGVVRRAAGWVRKRLG